MASTAKHKHRLWVDADPSGLVWTGLDCDDDLAILATIALHQGEDPLSIEGLSVCGGNAPLEHAWSDIHKLLNHVDSFDITPVRGYGWRSMYISRLWLRLIHWISPDMEDSEDAVNALIRASHESPPLTILTLGPPTNIAKAFQKDPSLSSRLRHVYMMGGELTNQRMDLNFVTDRAAARAVVNANVPTTLVPIQLCAQAIIDSAFVNRFEQECCPSAAACALLPKMKQQQLIMPTLVNSAVKTRFPPGSRWIMSSSIDNGFIPWDIVAVLVVANPELFDQFEYHNVEFSTCLDGEPCDMTMEVNALGLDTPGNHSGITRIPHVLKSEKRALDRMHQLLCQVPAHGPRPSIMMGFASQLASCLLVPVGVAIVLFLLSKWSKPTSRRSVNFSTKQA